MEQLFASKWAASLWYFGLGLTGCCLPVDRTSDGLGATSGMNGFALSAYPLIEHRVGR